MAVGGLVRQLRSSSVAAAKHVASQTRLPPIPMLLCEQRNLVFLLISHRIGRYDGGVAHDLSVR